MPTAPVGLPAALVSIAVCTALSACGSGAAAEAAAEAAYAKCHDDKGTIDLLRLDGSSVLIEVKGQDARALANADDAADNLTSAGGLQDDDMDGLMVSLVFLTDLDCLVEATGYPGSSDQLTDGERWDGWMYSEEGGAGSEATLSFTATT